MTFLDGDGAATERNTLIIKGSTVLPSDSASVTIRVGVPHTRSGGWDRWHYVTETLIRLGAEYLNKRESAVSLVVDVTEAPFDECPATAARLLDRGSHVLLGNGLTACTRAMLPVTHPFATPVVGYSETSEDLSDFAAYPYYFRVVSNDLWQGTALADLCAHFGWDRVAVVHTAVRRALRGIRRPCICLPD